MTSFAFILGVLPLAFATGAGAGARNSVGTAVAGGMLASTFLSIVFIPVLYVDHPHHRARQGTHGRTVRRSGACLAAPGTGANAGSRLRVFMVPASASRVGVTLSSLSRWRRRRRRRRQRSRPMERVTLEEAVDARAGEQPDGRAGGEAILRAEGLLQQARAATLPT